MDIGVRATLLMRDDPDACLDFCRGALGFEVRHNAGPGGMRGTTAGQLAVPARRFAGFPFTVESGSPTGST
jgi:hypothetical protein